MKQVIKKAFHFMLFMQLIVLDNIIKINIVENKITKKL